MYNRNLVWIIYLEKQSFWKSFKNPTLGNVGLIHLSLFQEIMSNFVYRIQLPNFTKIRTFREKHLKKIRIHIQTHRQYCFSHFPIFLLIFNYFIFVICNVKWDYVSMLMLISVFWFCRGADRSLDFSWPLFCFSVGICCFTTFLFFVLVLILCMCFLSIGYFFVKLCFSLLLLPTFLPLMLLLFSFQSFLLSYRFLITYFVLFYWYVLIYFYL